MQVVLYKYLELHAVRYVYDGDFLEIKNLKDRN